MAENTAFSTSGEDVIARGIDVNQEEVPVGQDLDEYYDIERTVGAIEEGDYKRVRAKTCWARGQLPNLMSI